MAWTQLIEKMAPEVRTFLEKAVPMANERLAVVLKAAETQFAKQPEFFKQVQQVAHPAAVHFRAMKTGKSIYDTAPDILAQWLGDTNQLATGTLAAAKGAKLGDLSTVPNWQKSHLPVDLAPIKTQAKIQDLQDQLKRYYRPEDEGKRATITKQLEGLVAGAKGQQAIKDMPRWLYLSPFSPITKSDFVLGVKTRFPTDVAAAMMTQDANTKNLRAAWRAVAGKFTNLGETRAFKRDMRQVWEQTLPMQERYYGYREQVEALNKQIAKAKGDKLNKLTEARDKLVATKVIPIYVDLQTARKAAFSKYYKLPGEKGADVRIALYREPDTRPWVQGLMSPEEIQVAEWHGKLMENARASLTAQGIPVLKQEEEYLTHMIHHIARGGKTRPKDVQAYIDRMLPKMSKFAHRTPGSLLFFPSVRAATDAYITGTSRKLAITELMRKYEPVVEGPLKNWPRTQQYFTKYFKQYTDRLMDDNFYEKLFRGTTWWMYLSKTATSLSVARKHAEKGIGLLASHPTDVLRSISPATRAGLELAFQRAGATPGSTARLTRNWLSTRSFFEAMSGVNAPERQRIQSMVNTVMAFPTNAVEMFERAAGISAAMAKATRKGLSHEETVQSVWQILADQSFVGKADRFLWMNKAWQQLLFLFAYTPGRITDTTIKRVLMSLPRQHIDGLKAELLQTAWKFPTDVFGTPYVKNMLMFMMGVGATEYFARHYLDSTIWKEVAFHLHLLREKGGETELYFWPYDLYKEGEKRGGKLSNPRPFIAAITESLLAFPQWQRYVKTIKGDIAPRYAGSKLRQAVALESMSAAEGVASKWKPHQEKRFQKAEQKAKEYREKSWPLGSTLRSLPPNIRQLLFKYTGL